MDTQEAKKCFIEFRNKNRDKLPDDWHIPLGAKQFLKVGSPDELGEPLSSALLFPLPLSEEDEKAALIHAKKCGITIPEKYLGNKTPITCPCGHTH
jgi:hypothetical protein